MGTIDSLDSNLAEQNPQDTAQTFETTEPPTEDAVPVIATTTAATRPEKVVYTYSTELNVANGKKPSLADYTATQPILVVTQEMTAPAATTTTTPDFQLNSEDVDYTTPPKTTAMPPSAPRSSLHTKTSAQTFCSPSRTRTAASVSGTAIPPSGPDALPSSSPWPAA